MTLAARTLAVCLMLLAALAWRCSSSQGGDRTTGPGPTASVSVAHRATEIVYSAAASPPAAAAVGDLIIAGVIGQGATSPPPGWTPIGAATRCGPSEFEHDVYYAWRIRQPGDSAFSFPNAAAVQLAAYADVDPSQPIAAFRVARHDGTRFELGALSASDAAGDAAHYQSLGVFHGLFTPPAGYAERQDGADATTAGDRLELAAGQSTAGTVLCTDGAAAPVTDDGVHLHVILRARRRS